MEPIASEAVGKRGGATVRGKLNGASKTTIRPNSVVRPSGREPDSLLSVFGSEAIAELHLEARATSDGLTWIAEKLEATADLEVDPERQGTLREVAIGVRSCSRASRVRDDGELEAVA